MGKIGSLNLGILRDCLNAMPVCLSSLDKRRLAFDSIVAEFHSLRIDPGPYFERAKRVSERSASTVLSAFRDELKLRARRGLGPSEDP